VNRKAKAVTWLVAVPAAALALWFGGPAVAHRMAARRASAAWARFVRCTVGDEPLAGEPPSERARRIELGVAARALSGARDPRDEGWPARCSAYAEALDRAWQEARGDDDLVGRTEQIAVPLSMVGAALHRGEAPTDTMALSYRLDGLFLTAAELHPDPGDAADVPPPPPAVAPLRLGKQVRPILPMADLLVRSEPLSGRTLRAWFSEGGICTLDASGDAARALLSATCRPVSPAVPASSWRTLIGLDDGAPPMIAVFDYERGGVYAAGGGERLVPAATPTMEGAYATARGFVATLDRTEIAPGGVVHFSPKYTLVRRSPDGRVSRDVLDRPGAASSQIVDAHVVAGHLIWLEGPPGGDHELFARAIGEGDPSVGPIADLGKLPGDVTIGRDAIACRTPEALFVDLPGGARTALVVRTRDRWMPPLLPEKTAGRFTCAGLSATYTAAEPAGAGPYDDYAQGPLEITQTRCAPDRCETRTARVPGMVTRREDVKDGKLAVTDLAGKVALAWIDGAVFLRVAPLADLDRAPVTVVVDADTRKAGGTLVHTLYLPTRQDGAAMILGALDGTYALRLDAAGKLAPVEPAQ
jgi:hypothetical protein